MDTRHPYSDLTPDRVLNAVESTGLPCDGRLIALNSYENRVYQAGIAEREPVVAKFYRPGRWSDEAILEEHAFTAELAERDIPAVAPLAAHGRTLQRFEGFRFAVYPRRPGRAPELEDPAVLEWMGRFLGRIHAVGAVRPFLWRGALTVESLGDEPLAFLLEGGFLPPDLELPFRTIAQQVLRLVRAGFAAAGEMRAIRLHGDCHPGNVLWTEQGPHFVDFDDCRMGPAVQDLWMLLSGERDTMGRQLAHIMKGYRRFHDFDPRELRVLEALRALRMIHYAGWLAKRWDDPAFPANFPWFNTQRYWQDQILALREQAAALEEPPLVLA